MKRILILLAVLMTCLVAFVACKADKEPAETIDNGQTTVVHPPGETNPADTDGGVEMNTNANTEGDTATPAETDTETTPPETETVHPHAWGDWSTTKEATCTEAGVSERTCVCGETEQETISSLGHRPGAVATCTTLQVCTVCNAELAAALGHTEVVDTAVAPTCTETGLTEGNHCSVCEEVLLAQETVAALGHTYTSAFTAPTATEDGYWQDTCSSCGDCHITETVTPASFTVTANNRSTIGYTGKAGENLVIPAVFQNGDTWYRVTSIGARAFYNCTGLTSITIPEGVTSVGSYAFSNCSGLTSIVIPDNVTSIGEWAFNKCSNLTSTTIPDSVTSIGEAAFRACSGLTNITVEEGNTVYQSDGNCLIEAGSKTLIAGCLNSVIPTDGSVTSIGSYAFSGCTSLTSITIPESVTSIGGRAFNGCSGLTSITLPDSVMSIGEKAFYNCTGLTAIYFMGNENAWSAISKASDWDTDTSSYTLYFLGEEYSEGLEFTSNGDGTCSVTGMGTCTDTDIVIPEYSPAGDFVTSIGDWAFSGCASLTSIEIPDNVTSIGNFAFFYCSSLTSITIPDSVTSIGESTFYGCTVLTSITIPDSVTSIGFMAFQDCTGLENICLGNGVMSIGNQAFNGCSNLTSITIPDSVTSIGDSAFGGCSSLANITVDDHNATYMSLDGNLYTKDGRVLLQYAIGKTDASFTVPDVSVISPKAFSQCTNLTYIIIPISVNFIGDYAFSNCSGLISVDFEYDTSMWYITPLPDCYDYYDGMTISVANAVTNATYFKSTYRDHYWYRA